MKPRFPIDTPAKVTQAREYLGLDKAALGRELRMGTHSRETIRRLEQGGNAAIPGPTQIALEYLVEKAAHKGGEEGNHDPRHERNSHV